MQRFKNILCVTTSVDSNNLALTRAVALAKNNQAELKVVVVIDEVPPNTKLLERVLLPEDIQSKIIAKHEQGLQEAIAPHGEELTIQTKVLVGMPFLEIIREILRDNHDLVIKAAENGGILDRVFGSEDMHLLRKCPCPVWLVKPGPQHSYKRILAAVDVEDSYPSDELNYREKLNNQILDMSSSLALSEFAKLDVINVWEAIGENALQIGLFNNQEDVVDAYFREVEDNHRKNLEVLVANTLKNVGQDTAEFLKPEQHLVKGAPRDVIPEYAESLDVDLVVLGTVARTGIKGLFMGNTAETILNRLSCSVLAIKPPGFVTPVTPWD